MKAKTAMINWAYVKKAESYLTLLVAMFAFLLVSGCATTVSTPTDAKSRAEARSAEYWQKIIAGEFASAYALLTPTSREAITPEIFAQQMRGMRVKTAKVAKAICADQSACNVELQMEVEIRVARVGFRVVPLSHQEVWTLSNGEMFLIRK